MAGTRRLIPAIGIRGREEQEKRATSSLLAVMRAVHEFRHALIVGGVELTLAVRERDQRRRRLAGR